MTGPLIFSPGDVCAGSYVIERLRARSPVSETYIARRKATGQSVVLTCSRFPSDSPLKASFLSNASKLTGVDDGKTPRVLAADITEGVSWVVREHVAGVISIWDFLTSSKLSLPRHVARKKQLAEAPLMIYVALTISIGAEVADVLGEFSQRGIYHGGLDPRRTIVLGPDGEPMVLDTGYGHLFGSKHWEYPGSFEQLIAPEIHAGASISERTDIYALGALLQILLAHGTYHYHFRPPDLALDILRRHHHTNPEKRVQSWEESLELWVQLANVAMGAMPSVSEGDTVALDLASLDPPSAEVANDIHEEDSTPALPPTPANFCAPPSSLTPLPPRLIGDADQPEAAPAAIATLVQAAHVDREAPTPRVVPWADNSVDRPARSPDVIPAGLAVVSSNVSRGHPVEGVDGAKSPLSLMARPGMDPRSLVLYGAAACMAVLIVVLPYCHVWRTGFCYLNSGEGNQVSREWQGSRSARHAGAAYPEY